MPKGKKMAEKFVAEIDPAELTIRLLEIGCKMKRPPGTSGQRALQDVRDSAARGEVPAYIVQDFEDMAEAAILYFGECVERGQSTN